MKKYMVLPGVLALLLTGCQTTEKPQTEATDNRVCVNFTAALDQSSTKATIDGDGTGVSADRCKLQVWWGDILFYEHVATVSDFKTEFTNILLIKDQKYDFLFWADNAAGSYYTTADLKAVGYASDYIGNNDARDAFFAADTSKTVTEAFTETIKLYRPFAQLNVITKDIPAIFAQLPNQDNFSKVVPEKVALKVEVPTVFNVRTGEASTPDTLAYEASVYTVYKTGSDALNTLSMDYFFAPAAERKVVDVAFASKNETSGMAQIDTKFTNIPLQRNYRTNILGNLLTEKGKFTIELVPGWNEVENTIVIEETK